VTAATRTTRGTPMRQLTLSLVILGLSAAPAPGQETRVSREALVAAAERGPAAAKGRDDAPITVVEFSDFRCSFCRKFWKETLPRIEADYISAGKVRLVYRHLVVLGPASQRAAEAAECAGEQGRFWKYHDALFEQGGRSLPDARVAAEIGLDPAAHEACVASGRHRERVLGETAIAQSVGATGTPAFLINGRLLIGAHPFETFKRVLDAMLGGRGPGAAPRPESPR